MLDSLQDDKRSADDEHDRHGEKWWGDRTDGEIPAADIFVFSNVRDSVESAADRIKDYGVGDKVDLSAIDANSMAGNGKFAVAATHTGEGQVVLTESSGATRVDAYGANGTLTFYIDAVGIDPSGWQF